MFKANVVQFMTLNKSLILRFGFDSPTVQNTKLAKTGGDSTNYSFHFDFKQYSLPKANCFS